MSPVFSCMVHVTQAGRCLYNKLAQLVQYHYNLASTTVTGIPMKEEQNASSSANYDVELLHPAVAHEELVQTEMVGDEICMTYDSSLLKKLKTGHMEGLIIPSKEGLPTETVTLKWCTPKSSVVELHHCTGAYRITPVDVNSRPSSCLTNFLLGGRAVMLEQPRKSGAKVISHMLASHGGEIFIHTIAISRSILEDPPSISEGCGGRVTDYRITNFGEFMKENRLAPATPAMLNTGEELPIDRAKSHIEKMTRYWPMVISNTIIFNMQAIDPITSLIVKEKLSEEDVDKCNKAIHHIEEMGSKNEALPTATIGARGKGPKREEQYRHMWSELENLIRAHSNTSPMHEEVLKCLLECKKPSEDAKAAVSPKRAAFEKVFMKEEKIETPEAEQAWKEFDKFQRMTEREKQDMNASETKSGEGPSMKKMKLSQEESLTRQGGPQNLLAMWTSRINAIHGKRHQEIAGRLEATGNMTELYPKMKKEQEQGENTETPNATKR